MTRRGGETVRAVYCGIRKEKKMTQAELAEKINVTDKAVSRWERGLGFPDIQTLEPLAQALGISVLELMRSKKKESTGDVDITETQYTRQEVAEMLQNADDISKQQKKQDKKWHERKVQKTRSPWSSSLRMFYGIAAIYCVARQAWRRSAT